jgi:hypothetical protein
MAELHDLDREDAGASYEEPVGEEWFDEGHSVVGVDWLSGTITFPRA